MCTLIFTHSYAYSGVFNAPIAEGYVKYLNLLEKKAAFVGIQRYYDGKQVVAITEIEEMLNKLVIKVRTEYSLLCNEVANPN